MNRKVHPVFAFIILGLAVLIFLVIFWGRGMEKAINDSSTGTANSTGTPDMTIELTEEQRRARNEDAPEEPTKPAEPATTAGNGTYLVGDDIRAGRYKTEGNGDYCGWFRMKDDSGDVHSIIASDSVDDGPMYVSVNDGEFVKFSGGCAWALQP
jgi:hypothetical protein